MYNLMEFWFTVPDDVHLLVFDFDTDIYLGKLDYCVDSFPRCDMYIVCCVVPCSETIIKVYVRRLTND